VFNVVATNADIQTDGDTTTITWSKANTEAVFVTYSYSIPLEFPELYELGPLELAYSNETFTEARPWYVAADPPPEVPPEYAGLLNITDTFGSARVIIQLNTGFTPEGLLNAQEKSDQRLSIQSMQNDLLSNLYSQNISNAHYFKTIPLLAMTVDTAALNTLINSSLVETISEDTLSRTLLSDSIPLIGANFSHSLGVTGFGQAVAILDTGVEKNHTFFGDRVIEEACFGTNGICA